MTNEIVKVVEQSGLEANQAQNVLNKFTKFFEDAKKWENTAKEIIVTSESQIKEMQQAREARLDLKRIRVEAEKTRKQLKERSLREGKAIDGIANVIKALVVPIEQHLENQEKFVERLEEEKKEKRLAKRIAMLQPYVEDITAYNLKDMSEQGFNQLYTATKTAHEAQKEAEKKAEQERIEQEKKERAEAERIRKENEKLRKEAEEREKKERAEQKKREEEQRKIEEQQRIEREKREKLEEELRRQKEEEQRKKQEQEEVERQSKLAPEKDKLHIYAEKIKSIETPEGLSVAGTKIVKQAEQKMLDISQWVKENIKNL